MFSLDPIHTCLVDLLPVSSDPVNLYSILNFFFGHDYECAWEQRFIAPLHHENSYICLRDPANDLIAIFIYPILDLRQSRVGKELCQKDIVGFFLRAVND